MLSRCSTGSAKHLLHHKDHGLSAHEHEVATVPVKSSARADAPLFVYAYSKTSAYFHTMPCCVLPAEVKSHKLFKHGHWPCQLQMNLKVSKWHLMAQRILVSSWNFSFILLQDSRIRIYCDDLKAILQLYNVRLQEGKQNAVTLLTHEQFCRAANPVPDSTMFPRLPDGCGRGWHQLHDLDVKWPHCPIVKGLGNQLLAQFRNGASLLDVPSGKVSSLSLSPEWRVQWCSWCSDNVHIAVLHIRVGMSPSHQQLCILDSKQPATGEPGTQNACSVHMTASHAFILRLFVQKPFSSKEGWPVKCISNNSDLIILPGGDNTAVIYSLPALAAGPQLSCLALTGQVHEPQEAAWTSQGQAVVQWRATALNRIFNVTIHMPHDGTLCHSLSLPIEGASRYFTNCLIAPHQPYLAVQVFFQQTCGMQLMNVAARSQIDLPTYAPAELVRICWSPTGRYLIVEEKRFRHPRGHLTIFSAPSGMPVFHDSESLLRCHDMTWTSTADGDLCLLGPGTANNPDMLMLKGAQPAEWLWLEPHRAADLPREPCPSRRWSFAPHVPLLVGYVDDTKLRQASIREGAPVRWLLRQIAEPNMPKSITGMHRQSLHISCIAWQPSFKMHGIFAAVSEVQEIVLVDAVHGRVLSSTPILLQSMSSDNGMLQKTSGLQWSADGSKLTVRRGLKNLCLLCFAPALSEVM